MADNNWNYYHDQYLNIVLSSLNNAEHCKDFIKKYLSPGLKLIDFFENCIDKLSDERLKHIVSSFFLGFSLYKNSSRIKYSIEKEIGKLPFREVESTGERFAYFWFLITLFHDLGYAIEDGIIKNFIDSESIFDKKPISIPKIYNKININNYDKYRICRWGVKDHGIYGGKIFFSEMCKLRKEKEDSDSGHYWGSEMETIYHYAAWTIMCHNMYFIKADDPNYNCYIDYKLNDFIDPSKREIALNEHPFLFLFSIIDSIEPIKILHDVSKFSNVDICFNDDSLEFKFSSLCKPLQKSCESRIISLNDWLTKVTQNTKQNSIKLYLGNKTISFSSYLSKYNLPIIFIKPQSQTEDIEVFYPFAIDTSIRHNLIHSCLLKDFENLVGITLEQAKEVNRTYWQHANNTKNPFHNDLPNYSFFGLYEKEGEKRISCKDGIKRTSEEIKLDFKIEGDDYRESFYVDESLCSYTKGKYQIQGILGLDFLKKHKWIIDFQKQSVLILDKST